MKKSGVLLFILFIMFPFIITSCGSQGEANGEEENTEKPVSVMEAELKDVIVTTEISAEIEPNMRVNVVPKTGGRVDTVHVQTGDRVSAGQVLVTLEQSEIRAQISQSEAELASAKLGLKQAQKNLERAEREFERTKTLFEEDVVSEQEFESAEDNYEDASDGVEEAKIAVEQAETQLEQADIELDNSVIRSPIRGIIAARNVDPGEMAAQNPVIVVTDIDTVKACANITEKNVNLINRGEKVDISVNAASEKVISGEVSLINPVADAETGTYALEVDIPNSDHLIKPGMSAAIVAETDKAEGVIAVPVDTVLERDDEDVVFVVQDGKAVRRDVETGVSNNELEEIKEGIEEGEQVVTAGQHMLNDGDSVVLRNRGDNNEAD